jgi:hypothetical protein
MESEERANNDSWDVENKREREKTDSLIVMPRLDIIV